MGVLCALACVTTFVGVQTSHAAGEWEAADFVLADGGATVVGFSAQGVEKLKTNKDLVIPERVERIRTVNPSTPGATPFQNKEIKSVVFPSTLKSIGQADFADNQLTSVTFPEGLQKINTQAFANNKLTKVTIPASVKTVSWTAFAGNRLSEIHFDGKLVTNPSEDGTYLQSTVIDPASATAGLDAGEAKNGVHLRNLEGQLPIFAVQSLESPLKLYSGDTRTLLTITDKDGKIAGLDWRFTIDEDGQKNKTESNYITFNESTVTAVKPVDQAKNPTPPRVTFSIRWNDVTIYSAPIQVVVLQKWTVTFDADGGEPVPAPQVIKNRWSASAPETEPVRDGYRFTGWYLGDAEEPFDFANSEITEDITLVARWEEVEPDNPSTPEQKPSTTPKPQVKKAKPQLPNTGV